MTKKWLYLRKPSTCEGHEGWIRARDKEGREGAKEERKREGERSLAEPDKPAGLNVESPIC